MLNGKQLRQMVGNRSTDSGLEYYASLTPKPRGDQLFVTLAKLTK